MTAQEALEEMRSWCKNSVTHHERCGCQLATAIEAELAANHAALGKQAVINNELLQAIKERTPMAKEHLEVLGDLEILKRAEEDLIHGNYYTTARYVRALIDMIEGVKKPKVKPKYYRARNLRSGPRLSPFAQISEKVKKERETN